MASKKTARTSTSNRTSEPSAPPPQNGATETPPPASAMFPIVGVGASAGGVQAFTQLVRLLPADPGLAVILMLHTEKHESALVEVLDRVSKMPVKFAIDGAAIERNHIYLSHPDTEVAVRDGKLRVDKKRDGMSLPIDMLFSALAQDQRSRAIGVILSGSGSDGALGIKHIKVEGGITFAQDRSAQFDQMPRAAISAGAIDFVMSPDDIARELVRIARHAYIIRGAGERLDDEQLSEIFALLKTAHAVDHRAPHPPAHGPAPRRAAGGLPQPPSRAKHRDRAALRRSADPRDRLLPRSQGLRGPAARHPSVADAGPRRGRADPGLGRRLRHRRGSLFARHQPPGSRPREELDLSDPDLRHRHQRLRHRRRAHRHLSREHRRRHLTRAPAPLLRESRRRLPRDQIHP